MSSLRVLLRNYLKPYFDVERHEKPVEEVLHNLFGTLHDLTVGTDGVVLDLGVRLLGFAVTVGASARDFDEWASGYIILRCPFVNVHASLTVGPRFRGAPGQDEVRL